MRRATVVVLDACGVGELPDAAEYGDAGSNTLVHVAERVGGLRLPTLQAAGAPVHGVGKIRDLFAGVGIDQKHEGATNAKGIAATSRLLRELDSGPIFVKLVETDQVYGHRHDTRGFHRALMEIDTAVADWLTLLRKDDLLILTADHGVDPTAVHTDHTREFALLLATYAGCDGRRHDGLVAVTAAPLFVPRTHQRPIAASDRAASPAWSVGAVQADGRPGRRQMSSTDETAAG